MRTTTDGQELMRRVSAGEADAFAALYDLYSPRVFGLVLHILGDRRGAEEVLQDVFWRVWRTAATYDPDRGDVDVWILLLARSQSIDALRRRRRERTMIDTLRDQAIDRSPGHSQEARDRTDGGDDMKAARQAFEELPEEQREVLGMTFYQGYSHREIARIRSIPLGTVKTRVRTAMQKLRENLARQSREVSTS